MGALSGMSWGRSLGGSRGGLLGRAAGLGVVVLLGVGACSGPPEVPAATTISLGTPSTLATSSPSASASGSAPSSSGSPSGSSTASNAYQPATSTSPAKNVPKPVMPALAKEKTFEGQKAFIKYWAGIYNYTFDTGDTALLKANSAPDCGFCLKSIDGAKAMYGDRNTWRVGEGVKLNVTSKSQEETAPGIHRSTLVVVDEPAQYFSEDGPSTKYKTSAKEATTGEIWLEYVNGSWRTVELRTKK